MTQPIEARLLEKISLLCEGELQSEDIEQLNALLSSSPLLQEEYLDQLMIHGLLKYEYGLRASLPMASPGGSSTRVRMWKHLYITAAVPILIAIVAFAGWWSRSTVEREVPIRVANSSFEGSKTIPLQPIFSGWYGDDAAYVHRSNRIAPADGKQMLQFIRSINQSDETCEVYQIIDLGEFQRSSPEEPVWAKASALVNSIDENELEDFVFAIRLYALTEEPFDVLEPWPQKLNRDVTYTDSRLTADHDQGSWQEIQSIVALQPDTRYLVLELSVRDGLDSHRNVYPGQFVDHVQVSLKKRGS